MFSRLKKTKIKNTLLLAIVFSTLTACREYIDRPITYYEYFDLLKIDTTAKPLIAVTDEEQLEYNSRVAYVSENGDTIIPFGKYRFYGSDSLYYFANVIEQGTSRRIAIDRHQNILYDVALYDNGPQPPKEGRTRILRNGKMGFANRYGQVVIPCRYDHVSSFHNGAAAVTFEAAEYIDGDGHLRVDGKGWFNIDKQGNKIEE